MFVIKNKAYSYDAYVTEENEWKGLLAAQTFQTEEDAKKALPENGEIIAWDVVVGLNKN
jgi:hypothetical protein